MATIRRGAPNRRITAEAAIGSVGEITAPRTNAALQDIPSTYACETMATTVIVAITRPTDSTL
ncbi:MAG: hypothetical protein ACXW0F_12785, partial [Gaiellaceae bacterium]